MNTNGFQGEIKNLGENTPCKFCRTVLLGYPKSLCWTLFMLTLSKKLMLSSANALSLRHHQPPPKTTTVFHPTQPTSQLSNGVSAREVPVSIFSSLSSLRSVGCVPGFILSQLLLLVCSANVIQFFWCFQKCYSCAPVASFLVLYSTGFACVRCWLGNTSIARQHRLLRSEQRNHTLAWQEVVAIYTSAVGRFTCSKCSFSEDFSVFFVVLQINSFSKFFFLSPERWMWNGFGIC